MTRPKFVRLARHLAATFRGQVLDLPPRRLSGQQFGWETSGTTIEDIGGEMIPCRWTLRCIAVGSKDWPAEDPPIDLKWAEPD